MWCVGSVFTCDVYVWSNWEHNVLLGEPSVLLEIRMCCSYGRSLEDEHVDGDGANECGH